MPASPGRHRQETDPIAGGESSAQDLDTVRQLLAAAREHKETVDSFSPEFSRFTGCSFPAHCRDLKVNRNGTLIVPLEVNYRFLALAQPMTFSMGVPLAVHIELYSPKKFKALRMDNADGS